MLYKETCKPKTGSGFQNILMVVGMAVGIILFVGLTNMLKKAFGLPWIEYLVYVVIIAFCYWLIKTRVQEFRYAVAEDELTVERIVGGREKLLLKVDLKTVTVAGMAAQLPRLNCKNHNFAFRKGSDLLVIQYMENGQPRRVTLDASEEFVRCVMHSLKNCCPDARIYP